MFTANLSRDWKMKKHSPQDSFSLDAIHNFNNNIFLIASENDSLVPPQTIENYLAAASNSQKVEYYLMKNTGHALTNPFRLYEFITIIFKIISKKDF
jgi:dienelactone hydrolase